MNILITGYAGFIGYHITKKIIDEKKIKKIFCLDNFNKYYSVTLKKNRAKDLNKIDTDKKIIQINYDIKDTNKIISYFKNKKVDLIIHLAAQAGINYSIINPQTYIDSNLIGFFSILELAKKNKIPNVIYASPSSVYGKNDKDGFSDSITDRERMRVYNILDTNIVPINFHALQRELPYSNIFNYSYTFDELVKEKFGVIYNSYNEGKMKWDTSAVTKKGYNPYMGAEKNHEDWKFKFAEDQLVDILINPYEERHEDNYKNTIFKLMVGADGISSGRPKYLSDQLWNKVLLNTMYSHKENGEVNSTGVGYKNTYNALGQRIGSIGVGAGPTKLLYLPNRGVNKKGYSEPKEVTTITKFTNRGG